MTKYADGYKEAIFRVIADAANDPKCRVSFALDILVDRIGWGNIIDELDTKLFALLNDGVSLDDLAQAIVDALYEIPGIESVAPFDGTINEYIQEGQSEQEWVREEDVLPFLERWRNALLEFE